MIACASVIGIIPYNSRINLASTIDKRDLKAKVNILIREFYFAETQNFFNTPFYAFGYFTGAYNWARITFKAKPNTKYKINFINKCHLSNDAYCKDGRFFIIDDNNNAITGLGSPYVLSNPEYKFTCSINDFGNIHSHCLIQPSESFEFDYTTDSNGKIQIAFIECSWTPHYMIGTWTLTSYQTGNSISIDFNTN